MSTTSGFRGIILDEFERRRGRNKRYSLRAYARDIGLSPSRLSEVLAGQGLSRDSAEKISRKIAWPAEYATYFQDLVEHEHGATQELRDRAHARLLKRDLRTSFSEVSEDAFRYVADWWHAAIVELTYLKTFQPTPAWLAAALELDETVAAEAVQRLLRLGMLVAENGTLKASAQRRMVESRDPSGPIRTFHRQVIAKARAAVDGQAMEERHQMSIFVPLKRDKLPQLFEELRERQIDLMRSATFGGDYDALYCLSAQMFRLDTGSPDA